MAKKVLCLGDSITYGFPYGPQASWVALAGVRLPCKMINAGENGDTVPMMAARLPECLSRYEPHFVIVLGGTNDAYISEEQDRVLGSLLAIIRTSKARGALPVVGLPTPSLDPLIENHLEKLRASYRRIAAEEGCPLLDFHTPMLADGKPVAEYFVDDVHPTREGYEVMATTAEEFLQRSLEEGWRKWS
ncbi:MAG: hypothetical protein PWQ31_1739 [Eubacteriales bacterium]|nr:hypothetical protein [Eubacteriales bacterium]